jgi:hypothetical protein
MSKLFIVPAFIAARPRLFWGIVILVVFAWLVISCGFTQAPPLAVVPPTAEPTLPAPTATPLPPARQNQEFSPPTATPLPEEWLATPDQTTGIILGASVLLLVVLIGTLTAMRSQQKKR